MLHFVKKLYKTIFFVVLFSLITTPYPIKAPLSLPSFEQICLGSVSFAALASLLMVYLDSRESRAQNHHKYTNNAHISDEIKQKISTKLKSLRLWKAHRELTANYLAVIDKFPFGITTESTIDLAAARASLDASHCGLSSVKETIIDYLAGIKLSGKSHKILCLSGMPGIGKTTVAESISKALGKKFSKITFGALKTLSSQTYGQEAELSGAGPIANALISAEAENPVILLDEIDKAPDYLLPQLLEILDPAQNKKFKDVYLGFEVDISNVTFIATANDLSKIARPLLDRMQVLELHPYSRQERVTIAHEKLIPQIAADMKLPKSIECKLHLLAEPLVDRIINNEAGVRDLKRYLISGAEKYARLHQEKRALLEDVTISPQEIIKTQHPEMLQLTPAFEIPEQKLVGVANGMYAAGTNGGGLLKIESICIPHGSGQLHANKLQGKFSAEAQNRVFAYVKSIADQYGIDQKTFRENDFMFGDQLYVPVDGPSAGLAHTVSLISTLTNTPVKQDFSMTGAIDMHGNVLPVNGYRDKILGSERSGIRNVVVPAAAKPVIESIKEDFKDLTIFYVSTVPEALKLVFETAQI
ncbi:AAA family ATPase [Candidatus Dependentiae bacterium]|nr:AAA family ATPase [Candidatus Dependentiae bacterium]